MADFDYDLILVGGGYAAATYLFTADLSWCRKIMVIGGADAWKKIVRGDGIVNHASYIFARDNPEATRPSEPTTRVSLKDENEAILKKAIQWLKKQGISVNGNADASVQTQLPMPGMVKNIARTNIVITEAVNSPTTVLVNGNAQPVFSKKVGDIAQKYTITYDQWNAFPDENWSNVSVAAADQTKSAMKIVYCGGSGPHADFFNKAGNLNKNTYIDLDTYMRGPVLTDTKKVAVLGPNAGIDAAVKAMAGPDNFYWLISGPQNSRPAWLSTKHYKVGGLEGAGLIEAADARIVNYPKEDRFTITYDNPKYTITFKSPVTVPDQEQPQTTLEVDYIVYATGQDPSKTETSTGAGNVQIQTRIGPEAVLRPILQLEKLTPIYDANKRFGHAFETGLGLQDSIRTNYTGLEVLGASALALANFRGGSSVKQAFFKGYGANTEAHDLTIQSGQSLENSLKAVQGSTWNDRSQGTRIYDYFDNLGAIPNVGDSLGAILKKLYQQTLVTADQLGVIKSQIEAVTCFDILAASTDQPEIIEKTSSFMAAIQAYKRKAESYQNALKASNAKPGDNALKAARDEAFQALTTEYENTFQPAADTFGQVQDTANAAAGIYVELLSREEQEALRLEGFQHSQFAFDVNNKIFFMMLFSAPKFLSNSDVFINSFLEEIPPAQRWLTNLLAIYQNPTSANVAGILNFNSMDRTQLAVLLAVQYPSIPVTDWPEISELILAGRKVSPWGYGEAQVVTINAWLKGVNNGTRAVGEFPELNT